MPQSTKHFPDEFPGKSMKDIPELNELVEEITVDGMTWITLYRCKISGEEWEEKYEQKGHGEVPLVRRVKPGSGSERSDEDTGRGRPG